MVMLMTRLTTYLLQEDWRNDLEPVWQDFFGDAAPDLDDIPEAEAPDLFPDRLGLGHPRTDADEVSDSHMTRAFDGLVPDTVRVVVIGQDPYPRREAATGRAFEDGAWDGSDPRAIAESLQYLLQSAAAHERTDLEISGSAEGWNTVCDAIDEGSLASPATPAYFDALAAQGVLFVNSAWTFSEKGAQQRVHLKIWKPVMKRLLSCLAHRDGRGPIVFLLLGGRARALFRAATWRQLRTNPEENVAIVYCAHPTAWRGRTYFDYDNPLTEVNRILGEMGDNTPIRWWPPNSPTPA